MNLNIIYLMYGFKFFVQMNYGMCFDGVVDKVFIDEMVFK